MISAGAVLVCALATLGRTEQSFPPIRLVEQAPVGTPLRIEGFVVSGQDIIHLVTSSWVFQTVQHNGCENTLALKKIASILVHEEWHVLHGVDEQGAYMAQLRALVMLDLGPSSNVYQRVNRARVAANLQKRRRDAGLVAATIPRTRQGNAD